MATCCAARTPGMLSRSGRGRGPAPAAMAVRARRCQASALLVLRPSGDGNCDHLEATECNPEDVRPLECTKEMGAVVVGREAPADVTIPIVTVSSAHARLEVVGGGLEIEDLGSTNGTFIDGIELKPNTKAALTVGQELVLGDMHLAAFTLVDEPEA
uniref:FHA domain-containing protein n=1 Tax=Prasinoderma singulare TaxID=676789 RepID=A0A7S3BRH5_9VIRI|mmetsp:Transcript_22289/g.68935  ORF Transcript_22289/g.68935 Transcript_22289/m.68935 type:complete len:157 (+) Transcript_22289:148-618(+)